jgi:hypothetical protein
MSRHGDIIQVIEVANAKRIDRACTGLIGVSRDWEDDYAALYLGDKGRGLDPDRVVRVRFVVRTDCSPGGEQRAGEAGGRYANPATCESMTQQQT